MSDIEEQTSQEQFASEQQNEIQDDYGEEKEEAEEQYKNNHDLIGVEGIIRAQKNEIEKKKLELRIENEKYFRSHPELSSMIQLFIYRVLDDRPDNILAYAGQFFDRAELHEVVKKSIDENNSSAQRIRYLNDLINGKTLIE